MKNARNIIIGIVILAVCIFVVLKIDEDVKELSDAKSFVCGTFDKINENFYVKISGTSETVKTAEPELYQSMREKGETLIPAILSLLLEDREGRIGGELVMLCDDILADMGEDPLDWDNSNPSSPSIFGKRTIELYEKYVGRYRPITKNNTRITETNKDRDMIVSEKSTE